ncbi:hypothetical protein ABZT23_38690 [Streptomyces sp. NPDC005386]|uniref:hypothetical protein n=1 Tax=Streptomyces sp. NPDC005386 TaxID=3154562 RepID=UPI0033A6CA6D
MNDETSMLPWDASADVLFSSARAELTRANGEELPHVCTGRHSVPSASSVLAAVLAADSVDRVRAVGYLYRLLLNRGRVFPATTPAARIIATLLDDPRTLAVARWERRAGERPLRAELVNWITAFADVARLDATEQLGAPQNLAAARAARPALHYQVAPLCEDDDPRVRDAAIAASALLLDDPQLASLIPRYAPLVRNVLATSSDSYYRWIARERLAAWGEDVEGLLAAEDERCATLATVGGVAEDPWDEGQGAAISWLAEQPLDTAAQELPGRWHPDWSATEPAAPAELASEDPVAVPASRPGYQGPWQIMRGEEHAQWTFTPFVGVGPLHFGMTLEEITDALNEQPAVTSHSHRGGRQQLAYADFTATAIRALFRDDRLGCVAVNAPDGPQVTLDDVPLTGRVPSQLEDWLLRRNARLSYSVAGDPICTDLGLAIRSQQADGIMLTRPLFLLPEWHDLWHSLPQEEWNFV